MKLTSNKIKYKKCKNWIYEVRGIFLSFGFIVKRFYKIEYLLYLEQIQRKTKFSFKFAADLFHK